MPVTNLVTVAWFLRVVELGDGRWACRRGRVEFDAHDDRQCAVDHLKAIASTMEPAELFLHRLDGAVVRLELEP